MTDNQYCTYKEIITQTESWKKTYSDIVLDEKINFGIFQKKYDEILLFGCGSSYNICLSASFFTKYLLEDANIKALPSSELLINPDFYIKSNKKYLIIGFSRSGETSETLDVFNILKDRANIESFAFTCKKKGTITNIINNYFICRNAEEKSVVMTVSFSSMLYAYCLMIARMINHKKLLKDFEYLIDYTERNLKKTEDFISNYIDNIDFSSYFTLGSEFNYGLSVEADLKMKEMSQIPSYSYYLYEFYHGPKSLLNKDSLCLILTLNKNIIKRDKIISELLDLKSKVLVIGCKEIKNIDSKNINYLPYESDFKFEITRSFVNIPVFQILAYQKTLSEHLNPDKPKNLDYTTRL